MRLVAPGEENLALNEISMRTTLVPDILLCAQMYEHSTYLEKKYKQLPAGQDVYVPQLKWRYLLKMLHWRKKWQRTRKYVTLYIYFPSHLSYCSWTAVHNFCCSCLHDSRKSLCDSVPEHAWLFPKISVFFCIALFQKFCWILSSTLFGGRLANFGNVVPRGGEWAAVKGS